MKKINELIDFNLQIENKYKDVDNCPEEEREEYLDNIQEFTQKTGITDDELYLLMRLREFGLFWAINTLVCRTIDKLKAEGGKPFDGVEHSTITYNEVLIF